MKIVTNKHAKKMAIAGKWEYIGMVVDNNTVYYVYNDLINQVTRHAYAANGRGSK